MLCCVAFTSNAQEQKTEALTFQEFKQIIKYDSDYKKSNLNGKSDIKAPERPVGLNPFTSMGGDQGSVKVWQRYMQALAKYKESLNKSAKAPSIHYKEKEKPGAKTNDSKSERVPISSARGVSTIVDGTLGGGLDFSNAEEIIAAEENNNSLSGATILPTVEGLENSITVSSTLEAYEINGELSGDPDVFKYTYPANQEVAVEFKPDPTNFDGRIIVFVINGEGVFIGFSFGVPTQPFMYVNQFSQETDLFFFVTEVTVANDIASRPLSETEFDNPNFIYAAPHPSLNYDISITNFVSGTDSYEVDFEKGQVLGLVSNNNSFLSNTLLKPNGEVGISTASYYISVVDDYPLPTNGDIGFQYIIPEDGTYRIVLNGIGDYETEFDTAKPRLDGQRTQYIYLDFTGVDDFTQREFFDVSEDDVPVGENPELDAIRSLSPLSAFLENWDIPNNRINNLRLAKKITDDVKETMQRDLRESGINSNFNVRILSDYGIESLGVILPRILERAGIEYSRVIVGGTIEESGIRTIGIATSVDVGNYRADDDALALLDEISVEAGATVELPDGTIVPLDGVSFNTVELGGNATKMDLVATGVANLVSHEAGHYIGNFHTNAFNDTISIMDEGGNGIFGLLGLADDTSVFGVDNIDADYVKDSYSQFEGALAGLDETDVNSAFGLTSGWNRNNTPEPVEELANLESQAMAELYELLPGTLFSYPNANSRESTLVVTPKVSGPASISLYDIQGRMISEVYNGNLEAGAYQKFKLNHDQLNLKTGVYIYKMNSNGAVTTHKFSVE